MKILQVGTALTEWGGIERYIAYLTEGLNGRSHHVTVLCPEGSPLDQRVSTPKEHLLLKRKFGLDQLPSFIRFFRGNRFDLVNVHHSRDYLIPPLAARLTKQPNLVMTRHVAFGWGPVRRRQNLALFDHIIGVSHTVKRVLEETGIPSSRVSAAYAGIPEPCLSASREKVRTQLGIGEEQFALGYFGRLVPEKGVDVLIRAARRTPQIQVNLFGKGPKRPQLEELAHSLGAKNVFFRGSVEDVANAMNAMDATVMPSLWEEAFGYAVVEAYAVGKPVIASRTGGLAEIIRDGETGLLFETGNADELGCCVAKLFDDRAYLQKLGAAAQQWQRAEFTVENMAERIEGIYRAVLEGVRARR